LGDDCDPAHSLFFVVDLAVSQLLLASAEKLNKPTIAAIARDLTWVF
jgi:hypothetical protein